MYHMGSPLRIKVLSLYKQILRYGQRWEAANSADTQKERQYIIQEAQTLFRKNKQLNSQEDIEQHVREAEARISLAIHYRIPYPRPINIPQNVLPPSKKRKQLSAHQRTLQQSKPIYIKSYDNS